MNSYSKSVVDYAHNFPFSPPPLHQCNFLLSVILNSDSPSYFHPASTVSLKTAKLSFSSTHAPYLISPHPLPPRSTHPFTLSSVYTVSLTHLFIPYIYSHILCYSFTHPYDYLWFYAIPQLPISSPTLAHISPT